MAATDPRNLDNAFVAGDESLAELYSVLDTHLYNKEHPGKQRPHNAYFQPIQRLRRTDPAKFERIARVAKLYIIDLGKQIHVLQTENEVMVEKVKRLKAKLRKVGKDDNTERSMEEDETSSEDTSEDGENTSDDNEDISNDDEDTIERNFSDQNKDHKPESKVSEEAEEPSGSLVPSEDTRSMQSHTSEPRSEYEPRNSPGLRLKETIMGLFTVRKCHREESSRTQDDLQLDNCQVASTPPSAEKLQKRRSSKDIHDYKADGDSGCTDKNKVKSPSPSFLTRFKKRKLDDRRKPRQTYKEFYSSYEGNEEYPQYGPKDTSCEGSEYREDSASSWEH